MGMTSQEKLHFPERRGKTTMHARPLLRNKRSQQMHDIVTKSSLAKSRKKCPVCSAHCFAYDSTYDYRRCSQQLTRTSSLSHTNRRMQAPAMSLFWQLVNQCTTLPSLNIIRRMDQKVATGRREAGCGYASKIFPDAHDRKYIF